MGVSVRICSVHIRALKGPGKGGPPSKKGSSNHASFLSLPSCHLFVLSFTLSSLSLSFLSTSFLLSSPFRSPPLSIYLSLSLSLSLSLPRSRSRALSCARRRGSELWNRTCFVPSLCFNTDYIMKLFLFLFGVRFVVCVFSLWGCA